MQRPSTQFVEREAQESLARSRERRKKRRRRLEVLEWVGIVAVLLVCVGIAVVGLFLLAGGEWL